MSTNVIVRQLLREEKAVVKRAKAEEKLVLKRAKAEERLALKRAKAEEKLALKRAKAEEKLAAKKRRSRRKHEVSKEAIGRMVHIGLEVSRRYPNGASMTDITQLYINTYGNINAYTGELCGDAYDVHAAIRGLLGETSPSSTQHWFRYGLKKNRCQVAPWVFVNKELAQANNQFGWKVSSKELILARRRNIGLWKYLPLGPNTYYAWSDTLYGPLPTDDILELAKIGRKIGRRGALPV